MRWRKLTYEQARAQRRRARRRATDRRGLSAERPVMILSANAIDHALLMLAGYTAGVPVAPISVAYSLQSQDFAKLKHIAELLDARPDLRRRHRAVRQGARRDRQRRRDRREPRQREPRRDVCSTTSRARPSVPPSNRPPRASGADTIAKFLFTSGSTGLPKGVINTHGMLTANQQQALQMLAVPRRAAAHAGRLAAVESHVRRQPQLQHGAAPRRHAGDRRRPSAARDGRRDRAQPHRNLAHDLFQRAGRLRRAAAASRARRSIRARVLRAVCG